MNSNAILNGVIYGGDTGWKSPKPPVGMNQRDVFLPHHWLHCHMNPRVGGPCCLPCRESVCVSEAVTRCSLCSKLEVVFSHLPNESNSCFSCMWLYCSVLPSSGISLSWAVVHLRSAIWNSHPSDLTLKVMHYFDVYFL